MRHSPLPKPFCITATKLCRALRATPFLPHRVHRSITYRGLTYTLGFPSGSAIVQFAMPDLHAMAHTSLIAEPVPTMPDLVQVLYQDPTLWEVHLGLGEIWRDLARSGEIWRECCTPGPRLLALVARFLSRSKLVTGEIRRSVVGAHPVMGGRSVVGTHLVVSVLLGDAGRAPPRVFSAGMPVVPPAFTRTSISRTRFSIGVRGFWSLPIIWSGGGRTPRSSPRFSPRFSSPG